MRIIIYNICAKIKLNESNNFAGKSADFFEIGNIRHGVRENFFYEAMWPYEECCNFIENYGFSGNDEVLPF